MKKFIFIVIVLTIGFVAGVLYAQTGRSVEFIFNDVWNQSTNTLSIKGV